MSFDLTSIGKTINPQSIGTAATSGNGWGNIFTLDNFSKVASPLADFSTIFGTFNQNNAIKKQNKLAQDAFNFNKSLFNRQMEKEDKAQQDMNNVWGTSY